MSRDFRTVRTREQVAGEVLRRYLLLGAMVSSSKCYGHRGSDRIEFVTNNYR